MESVNSIMNIEPVDANFFLRKRYYVIFYLIMGWIAMMMLRTNLSICLVDMTSNKTYILDNVTYIEKAEFDWSPFQKGMVLSSFSWGLLLSPMGGLLATRFGGVKTFGYGILFTGLLTILSPHLIRWHFSVYLVGRVMEGVLEGISVASQGEIFVHWVPPHEKTFLSNSAYFGFSLGIIVSYPVAGYLIRILNWEYTFYITGGIAALWSSTWLVLIKESPNDDKFMLKAEKNFFQRMGMTVSKNKIAYPWRRIFASKPLWAVVNERFVESWSVSFFAYCLPLYIKDVYAVDIQEIGWLTSIPFYFELFARIPGASFADYLRKKKKLSQTAVHKAYILGAQIGGLIFLIVTAITDNFLIGFVSVSLSRSCLSMASISYSVLPLDLGAHYSSFITGLCMTGMSIGYIFNPLVLGLIVANHRVAEWSRYFFCLCGVNVWSLLVFAKFGSGELQPWADQGDCKIEMAVEHKYSMKEDDKHCYVSVSMPKAT